jgi:hypothetical protein
MRKIELDGGSIICEQCALIGAELVQGFKKSESDTEFVCATCAALNTQERLAEAELARVRGLPGSDQALRKWTHLFRNRWDHQCKAHGQWGRAK